MLIPMEGMGIRAVATTVARKQSNGMLTQSSKTPALIPRTERAGDTAEHVQGSEFRPSSTKEARKQKT